MVDDLKRVPVVFYRTQAGSEPVREWQRTLTPEDKRVIGNDIKTVEFGWPVGMPVCRPMANGLWEVRSSLSGGRSARVLFCTRDGEMYLLQGFMKKSQRTPQSELEVARRRQREVTQ